MLPGSFAVFNHTSLIRGEGISLLKMFIDTKNESIIHETVHQVTVIHTP